MKTIEIQGTSRTIAERSSEQVKALKAIRRSGSVPCVLYGGGQNYNFQVTNEGLRKLIYSPDIYAVDLFIDGQLHKAVMREIQFHPVKDNVLHVDFYEVNEQKPIIMEVPIKLTGLAEGVKSGGKLQQQMRMAKVKAIYTNIPEQIVVDVTELKLGKSIKISDLSFDNLEFANPQSALVCTVKATRQSAATAEAEK